MNVSAGRRASRFETGGVRASRPGFGWELSGPHRRPAVAWGRVDPDKAGIIWSRGDPGAASRRLNDLRRRLEQVEWLIGAIDPPRRDDEDASRRRRCVATPKCRRAAGDDDAVAEEDRSSCAPAD